MDWLGRKGRRCRQRSGFKRAGEMDAREGAAGKGASSRRKEGNNNTIRCDDDDDDDDWSATKIATALPRRQFRHCRQRSVDWWGIRRAPGSCLGVWLWSLIGKGLGFLFR